MSTLAIFQSLGPWEMGIILILALLLFGRRLPEVGKSLGKGIVEFKRGIKGIEDEIESESTRPSSQATTSPPKNQAQSEPPPLPEAAVDPRIPQSAQIHERVKQANETNESTDS